MRIDNPWIAGRCAQAQVPPNRLPTLLQEQYGQLGEDLILEGVLKSYFARAGLDQARVRYVEIGANHPIQTSNTFLFASKWKGCGLLVEANPQLIHELERVRPGDRVLNLAVVPPGYPKEVRINLASNSELSSLDAGHITSFGAIGQLAGEALVPSVTLDQLLEVHFPDGLHLLSIDIEGLDLEVLAQSRFSRRPTFVVAEPSRHYHADAEANFGRVMTSKGYCEVARTDYNLIYADASQVQMVQAPACNATERPNHLVARKVRTFDVFDTLIARRCIHPHQIHVQAEIRSGIQGFALARVQAEAAVARTEYGMTDIYRQLARTLGWDEALSAKMMALELRLELDNVIPIAQGLAQLDNESVLITDMYLPEEAIRQMLRKVGVNLHLPMIRSSAGKHSGRVWKALSERGWDCWHLGDNAVSDMANARRFGMKPVHLSVAAPTRLEATLYVEGFTELAQALREARLGADGTGLPTWLYTLQAELNVPTLLLSASYLVAMAASQPVSSLLFSSRDCRHLQHVHSAVTRSLQTETGHSAYWYTSRLARGRSSDAYLRYCRELFKPDAVLVDLCGTGASIAKLFDRLALGHAPQVFLAEWVDSPAYQRAMLDKYGVSEFNVPVRSLFSSSTYCHNNVLEWLNLAPEGMVLDVDAFDGGYLPVRDNIEFAGEQLSLVTQQSRFLAQLAERLAGLDFSGAYVEISTKLPQLLGILQAHAASLDKDVAELEGAFQCEHEAADERIMSMISRAH